MPAPSLQVFRFAAMHSRLRWLLVVGGAALAILAARTTAEACGDFPEMGAPWQSSGVVTVNAYSGCALDVTARIELYVDDVLIADKALDPPQWQWDVDFQWDTLDPSFPAYDGFHSLEVRA